jgi:hypothetical protein
MSIINRIRTEYNKLIESGIDKNYLSERDFAKERIEQCKDIIKECSPETLKFAKEYWNI